MNRSDNSENLCQNKEEEQRSWDNEVIDTLEHNVKVVQNYRGGDSDRSVQHRYNNDTKESFVVKTQPLFDLDKQVLKKTTLMEILTLNSLSHPHIVPISNLIISSNQNQIQYQMPYYSTCLQKFVVKMWSQRHKVEDRIANLHSCLQITHDLFHAIHYLHSCGWMHLDLKLDNIMLTDDRRAMIIDFGLAQILLGDRTRNNQIVTRWYRSCEIQCGTKGLYGSSADVWSLGIILVNMFFNIHLFPKEEDEIFHEQVNIINPPNLDQWLDKYYHNFAMNFLKKIDIDYESCNIKKFIRDQVPEVVNLLTHIWSSNFVDSLLDLIEQCLCFDPSERISCEKALTSPIFINNNMLTNYKYREQDMMLHDPQSFIGPTTTNIYSLLTNNIMNQVLLSSLCMTSSLTVMEKAAQIIGKQVLNFPLSDLDKRNNNVFMQLHIMNELKWKLPFDFLLNKKNIKR